MNKAGVARLRSQGHIGSMENSADYTGYRFEYARPDANSPGGVLKRYYLAVAISPEEAHTIVGQMVGNPGALKLIDEGADALAQARKLGVPNGHAREQL